jgi:hypothetical protein
MANTGATDRPFGIDATRRRLELPFSDYAQPELISCRLGFDVTSQ